MQTWVTVADLIRWILGLNHSFSVGDATAAEDWSVARGGKASEYVGALSLRSFTEGKN